MKTTMTYILNYSVKYQRSVTEIISTEKELNDKINSLISKHLGNVYFVIKAVEIKYLG
jgi:hypothetical protein